MSIKILLDPVYSTYPTRCSSSAKCMKLVERFKEAGRQDVFFYWLYPTWLHDDENWEREKAWLTQHENVTLLPIPYNKDRMREYMKFTDELDKVYAFNGNLWDWDGIFTSRTSMIPLMRAVMTSPRAKKHARELKTIVDFEEMSMMSFRPTVALSDVEAQELMTCSGYLAADKVMLMTEAEKHQTMQIVRQYMSPAMIRKIDQKITLASQVMFTDDDLKVKAPEYRFKKGTRDFVLSFTGRMESASNLDVMYEVMDKQFIWRGAHLKFLICTVTPQAVNAPPDFVEVQHPNREEFWGLIKERMDLVLALHNNVEWSLSIFEPMLLGTPVLLNDQKWSRDILGDDYPFYTKGVQDTYAWVRQFYNDYEKMYKIFADYHANKLLPMFRPGGKYGISMYDVIYQHYADFEARQKDYVAKNFMGKGQAIPAQIADFVKDRQSFVLFDVIKEMDCFDVLEQKTREGDRDKRRIVFSTDWNELRMLLKYQYGWKDGKKVGEFVR